MRPQVNPFDLLILLFNLFLNILAQYLNPTLLKQTLLIQLHSLPSQLLPHMRALKILLLLYFLSQFLNQSHKSLEVYIVISHSNVLSFVTSQMYALPLLICMRSMAASMFLGFGLIKLGVLYFK